MCSDNFDFVYASDVEAEQSTTIENIAIFSTNTQYIFIDSSYTDKELKERVGWGHLSYQEVIDLAKRLKNSSLNTLPLLDLHVDVPAVGVIHDDAESPLRRSIV